MFQDDVIYSLFTPTIPDTCTISFPKNCLVDSVSISISADQIKRLKLLRHTPHLKIEKEKQTNKNIIKQKKQ